MPTGTWTVKTNIPSRRYSGGGAGLGQNTGYFYYGYNPDLGEVGDCHEYNKIGDFWTQKSSGQSPRQNIASFGIGDDKAYAALGSGSPSTLLNQYAKSGNSWSAQASVTSDRKRDSATGASLGLYGYVHGGFPGGVSSSTSNLMDEYSQAGNTWTNKTDGPAKKNHGSCPVSSDLILFAYGLYLTGSYQTAHVYSQTGNSWASVPDGPPSARAYVSGQGLTANGTKGYIFGGQLDGNSCDEYNPVTQIWESKANMPANNYRQLSAAIGTKTAYLVGGNSVDNVTWEFAMPELPVIINFLPVHEQTDVPLDSNIQFDITHPDGINPDTINVQINGMNVIVSGVFQAGYSGTITEI